MDLETRIYKYSLMIGGALLTVLFLLCTIVYIFISQELGWGTLMFVSMLISIGCSIPVGIPAGIVRKSKNLKTKKPLMQNIIRNHNQRLIIEEGCVRVFCTSAPLLLYLCPGEANKAL